MTDLFEQLIAEAAAHNFSGWDFSYLKGRWQEQEPPWSYREMVISHIPHVNKMLDMGTGGGEFLVALPQRPSSTCATEQYTPNIPIARGRLEPLGVHVFAVSEDSALPFEDETFDLIINRHESFDAKEVFRVLKPNGRFLTQQVGGRDNLAINQWLQETIEFEYEEWTLEQQIQQLSTAGFQILHQDEAFPPTHFLDIGAVVYYLRAIPWQIEDFSIPKYRQQLYRLHQHIQTEGSFKTESHRMIVEACK